MCERIVALPCAHLAPGHLAQYAGRSALGPAPEPERAQKVALSEITEKRQAQLVGLNGKGGTRTLDPGIMRAAEEKRR